MPHQFVAGEGHAISHCKGQSEPGRFAAWGRFGQNKILLKRGEAAQESLRVMPTFLDKPIEASELCDTDSSLHVGDLQVKAEM